MVVVSALLLSAHASGTAAGYRFARIAPPAAAAPAAGPATAAAFPAPPAPAGLGRNLLGLMAQDHAARALLQAVAAAESAAGPRAARHAPWPRAPALLVQAQAAPLSAAGTAGATGAAAGHQEGEVLAPLLATTAQALEAAAGGGRGGAAGGGERGPGALPAPAPRPAKKQRVPLLGHDTVQEVASGQHAAAAAAAAAAARAGDGGAAAADALVWLPPPATWRGVCAAVATWVPRPLLAGCLAAALLNLATMAGLFLAAARGARVPPLRHLLVHVARMRGGLRVLAPVAEEALAVMVERDWDEEDGGGSADSDDEEDACGGNGWQEGSRGDGSPPRGAAPLDLSFTGAPAAGSSADGSADGSSGGGGGGGARRRRRRGCVWSARGGRRLLVSSAWHWGSAPDGSGPWLPLVPRYLLPSDGGWLGPGQMARLAELAYRFYGCACGSGPGGPGGAPGAPGGPPAAGAPDAGGCAACWRALCVQKRGGAATGDANAKRHARAEAERQLARSEAGGAPRPQQQQAPTASAAAPDADADASPLGGSFSGGRGNGSSSGGGAPPPPAAAREPITSLELEHLEAPELRVIAARGLAALPHARRLTLRWCQISGQRLRPLLPALLAHPSLETLTLERCTVDEAGAGLLRSLLAAGGGGSVDADEPPAAGGRGVRTLRLVRCSLPVAAALALADGLRTARGLRAFVFSGNAVEPTAARGAAASAFADALRSAPPALRHVTLGFSRGCPTAADALAAVVADGAAPRGLRQVVLHRREVSPGGLASWASALATATAAARVHGGAPLPLRSAASAPAALTLRATTLQALDDEEEEAATAAAAIASAASLSGAGSGASAGASASASSSSSWGSLRDAAGGAGAAGAAAVAARAPPPRLSAALRARRTVSAGVDSAAGDAALVGADRRLLLTEELPITFVLDADRDAFGEAWLMALAARLAARAARGAAAAAATAVPTVAAASPGASRDQGRCKPPAAAAEAEPDARPVRDTGAGAGGGAGGGVGGPEAAARPPLPPPPRLCVLSSADTGDAVATALKGLPLTALNLSGLELGPRVGGFGGQWGGRTRMGRAATGVLAAARPGYSVRAPPSHLADPSSAPPTPPGRPRRCRGARPGTAPALHRPLLHRPRRRRGCGACGRARRRAGAGGAAA
jgi:hypothetical protein